MEPYTAIILWHDGGLRWSERQCWTTDDESAVRIFKTQAETMRVNRKVDAELFIARKGKRVVFNG